jgi:ribosomal protein S6
MYTFIFYIQKLENNLTSVEKELQRARKGNVTLARYINIRRKKEAQRKEEDRKKTDEQARRKAMVVVPTSNEGQSSKDV